METSQIKAITQKDPYLKNLPIHVIYEHELPEVILSNNVYFLLLEKGQTKAQFGTQSYTLGHWTLLETIQKGKSPSSFISYWDPMGDPPSVITYQKILGTALINDFRMYINTRQIQLNFTQICGGLVTYVALLRARGFSPASINKYKLSKNLLINATTITDIINSLMPKHMDKIQRFSLDFV